jgi:hypothetical protein
MGQHLLRLAAEDHGGQAAPPMRGHYDQVAALVLGCLNDGLPGVIVARPDSLNRDASRLAGLLNEGELFGGELHGFRVNGAGEVGRDQSAWRSSVQRLGDGQSDDLGLRELREAYAMPNCAFAEFAAVGRNQDAFIRGIGLVVDDWRRPTYLLTRNRW